MSRNSGREIQQAGAGGAGERAMNRSPIPSVPSHTFSLSPHSPSFLPFSSFVVVVTPPTSYKLYVASQPAKTFNVTATPTRRHLDPDAICGGWSAPLLPLHVFVESTNSFPDIESSSPPSPVLLLLSLSLSTPLEILDMCLRWGCEVVAFISARRKRGWPRAGGVRALCVYCAETKACFF